MLEGYTVREGKLEEQRELTQLCVRATRRAGYGDAFIERAMPALTITVPLLSNGCVQVTQDAYGRVAGVVAVTTTMVQGIALLYGLYVDPPFWKCGVGRRLFGAATARAKSLDAGALMIYAEPSAEGFYRRMGAVRIGEGPFVYSPEVELPRLLYLIPRGV